jgi:hypothetical protein
MLSVLSKKMIFRRIKANAIARAHGAPMVHENWRRQQSRHSGSESESRSQTQSEVDSCDLRQRFPTPNADPDGFGFRYFRNRPWS